MPKTLKYWNGRGHGKYINGFINVAAYSQKEAAELINKACDCYYVKPNEIREYYSNCWGNSMTGIKVTEPCVYVEKGFSGKPIKVL